LKRSGFIDPWLSIEVEQVRAGDTFERVLAEIDPATTSAFNRRELDRFGEPFEKLLFQFINTKLGRLYYIFTHKMFLLQMYSVVASICDKTALACHSDSISCILRASRSKISFFLFNFPK
jgi:hypothetical protein